MKVHTCTLVFLKTNYVVGDDIVVHVNHFCPFCSFVPQIRESDRQTAFSLPPARLKRSQRLSPHIILASQRRKFGAAVVTPLPLVRKILFSPKLYEVSPSNPKRSDGCGAWHALQGASLKENLFKPCPIRLFGSESPPSITLSFCLGLRFVSGVQDFNLVSA